MGNENEKIDIIILSDNNHNTVGGEQESTKIILQGLSDSDYKTAVIHPGLPGKNLENIKYFDLTPETRIKHVIKKPWSMIKYILDTKKIIKNTNPKVIHTQAQVSFFIVAFLKRFYMIPKRFTFIHTERGLYLKYNLFFKRIFMFFMTQLDVLVTTTEYNMNCWESALNKKKIKSFQVIPNTAGLEFENFQENLKKRNDNEQKVIIGFAGRYCDWKNWPLAIEIIDSLNKKVGDRLEVRMAIGCLDEESKIETNKMFRYLEKMLDKRFEGQINISLSEMNLFYYDIDVFILTSKKNTESFGRTLIEAMSRKNVVFTTPAGGSEEVVPSQKYVFYSVNELVEKITKLMSDSDLLEKSRDESFQHVKRQYSLKKNVDLHESLYKRIIDAGDSR
ncbi:glycosyltransferase family 4 protein [Exiguobacterium sp.]|uniref:glycosyltransferase family 4 protein n=1 Tax=Exiguobacterium sp. TaxID=44751 RepID=UPI00263A9DDB|nr:glycosyltransferase family 4 protein [Exiguobacterium sp.]MCC5893804.1 glycosyltransferase family 4 protein [Exiguobacterium sp.]